MARIPRSITVYPDSTVHKVWRGHNREFNLGTEANKQTYMQLMNEDIESAKFHDASQLFAAAIMGNHGHEVSGVTCPTEYSNHMRRHHSRYGAYFNKITGRRGKVAEDRPRTNLLGDTQSQMRATFYVHANPVRANIVGNARDYYWTTHNLYAFGKREPWMKHVKFPIWYLELGKTPLQRQKKYRELFQEYLSEQSEKRLPFFTSPFIGPEHWVQSKLEKIKQWRQEHSSG